MSAGLGVDQQWLAMSSDVNGTMLCTHRHRMRGMWDGDCGLSASLSGSDRHANTLSFTPLPKALLAGATWPRHPNHELKEEAAPGVDGLTWKAYEAPYEEGDTSMASVAPNASRPVSPAVWDRPQFELRLSAVGVKRVPDLPPLRERGELWPEDTADVGNAYIVHIHGPPPMPPGETWTRSRGDGSIEYIVNHICETFQSNRLTSDQLAVASRGDSKGRLRPISLNAEFYSKAGPVHGPEFACGRSGILWVHPRARV
jgi:hypothetical protein